MAQPTHIYKRSLSASVGAGMSSVFGGSGRRYYILEHKVSTRFHKAGESQEIIVDQIELGRDPKCQVRFDEDFKTVSRRHAAIVKDGDNWKLVQLSQTNSTYLNGRKVQKEWYLQNGDEIQLSTNGPKLGFILPQGEKGLVKSIGLSHRLSLFRQQALRPYKQAITALSVVLVLAVGGLISWNYMQHKEFIQENKALAARFQRELGAQDSIRRTELARRDAEYAVQHRQDSIRYAREIARYASQTRNYSIPTLLDQACKDVYFLQVDKVVLTDGNQEWVLNCKNPVGRAEDGSYVFEKDENGVDKEYKFGWTGTGFLLNDGRFVTARHCIEGWLYNDLSGECGGEIFNGHTLAESSDTYQIVCYLKAFSSISDQVFEFKSTDFTIDRSKDKKIAVGVFEDGSPRYARLVFPARAEDGDDMWGTDWAYTGNTGGSRGELAPDADLSRNLLPSVKLYALGFPQGIGVQDGSQEQIQPIISEMTTARRGLSSSGCILHSSGTDHGNSGGPIMALKDDGKLVVIGIVSRGDIRTEQFNWAVPICSIY